MRSSPSGRIVAGTLMNSYPLSEREQHAGRCDHSHSSDVNFPATARYATATSLAVVFSRPGGQVRPRHAVSAMLWTFRAPRAVSLGVLAVSSRTVMNNAG